MRTLRMGVVLAALAAIGLSSCASDEQGTSDEPGSSEAGQPAPSQTQPPEPATTTVPEDPSCRDAVDFTLGVITSSAQQTVGDIESFATEDELGEAFFSFLLSLPEEIDIDAEEACGGTGQSAAELKKGLDRVIRSEPEPVTDLTLGLFAIGCSDDPLLGTGDTTGDDEAFIAEVCPVVEDHFERRGFSLEGSSGEPGFL